MCNKCNSNYMGADCKVYLRSVRTHTWTKENVPIPDNYVVETTVAEMTKCTISDSRATPYKSYTGPRK